MGVAILHYIDNEPSSGEWDSTTEAGSSTITRSTDASFPERPSTGSGWGLRTTIVGTDLAYVTKNLAVSLDPGGWIYYGFWLRPAAMPSANTLIAANKTGVFDGFIYLYASGAMRLGMKDDAGGDHLTGWVGRVVVDRWTYIVMAFKRATGVAANDGESKLYQGGVEIGSTSGVDNYDRYASIDAFYLGVRFYARDGYQADYDEIKIADSYPEPYVPTPADEYPSADRTVVLYRQGSSDSREFADYCVSELGVPRCNLVPLPNATSTESLADYATFQTEVETDLASWLGRNPTVASNCSAFLISYGVPGYFTSGGVKHSAASRLMNYGTVFGSQTANPLYNPTTVARLTKTDLGGKYLATRIDADSLAHAKDIIDAGATVSALSELPDADKLYSDDATYLASLACQKLRILTATLGTYANDAFVWGDTGTPSFGSAGSRACFVDDSADATDTLRATSEVFDAVVTNGYAAGLGCAETADTFDAGSFLEMLRLGGTLGEAFAVAIRYLDYTAVPVGSPLMTAATQKDGYNLYRGEGIENVDSDTPVAYFRGDQTSGSVVAAGHSASTKYTYVLRPVRGSNELITPDLSCRTEFETDGSSDWVGDRPAGVDYLEAEVIDAGKIRLRWGYTTPYGATAPADFGIYYAGSSQIASGSPQETVSYDRDRDYSVDLTLIDGTTYWLAATARSTGGVESHLSEVVGPFVAKATVPAAPAAYVRTTF